MSSFRVCAFALVAACAPRAPAQPTLEIELGESTAPGPPDVPPLSREDPARERVARAPLASGAGMAARAARTDAQAERAASAEPACPTPSGAPEPLSESIETRPRPITTIPRGPEPTAPAATSGTVAPPVSSSARAAARANGTTLTAPPFPTQPPAPTPPPAPTQPPPTPAATPPTPTTPPPTNYPAPQTPQTTPPTTPSGEPPTGVLTPPPPSEP